MKKVLAVIVCVCAFISVEGAISLLSDGVTVCNAIECSTVVAALAAATGLRG